MHGGSRMFLGRGEVFLGGLRLSTFSLFRVFVAFFGDC